MTKKVLLFGLIICLISACSAVSMPAAPIPANIGKPTGSDFLSPTPTATSLPTFTPRPSFTPTLAPTATITPILPTLTPVFVVQGPGKIVCPILLYHHIALSAKHNPYYVPPDEFTAEMQALKDWGYTSITPTLLVDAINFGAPLPARPIIISFDDGDASVFDVAYPVMKQLGFIGVNYIVVNYVGADGFMSVIQLKELSEAGWETGSHSMTHGNLTQSRRPEWEVVQSRHSLEKLLGVPVETFAYPFGIKNEDLVALVKDNYRAGMGLGSTVGQYPANIYYLWRRPVDPGWDIKTFGSFLPWNTP